MINRLFNLTRPYMSPQLPLEWDGPSKLNRRRRIWKRKLALSEDRPRNWRTRLINWRMLSMIWKKEIRRNRNKANKLIKMMFKLKKEPIKFLRKNYKNYCKVLNNLRNDPLRFYLLIINQKHLIYTDLDNLSLKLYYCRYISSRWYWLIKKNDFIFEY